jgi:hypothetical protein
MSRSRPQPGCVELSFDEAYPMDEPSEVALEDYARVLTRARAAEAVRVEPSAVGGVHLCGPEKPPAPPVASDIQGFARSLAVGQAGGLGWS